jgi:hypothetical protein
MHKRAGTNENTISVFHCRGECNTSNACNSSRTSATAGTLAIVWMLALGTANNSEDAETAGTTKNTGAKRMPMGNKNILGGGIIEGSWKSVLR